MLACPFPLLLEVREDTIVGDRTCNKCFVVVEFALAEQGSVHAFENLASSI